MFMFLWHINVNDKTVQKIIDLHSVKTGCFSTANHNVMKSNQHMKEDTPQKPRLPGNLSLYQIWCL